MVLSIIWTGLAALSILCAAVTGQGQALSAAVLTGAQSGVTLAVSIAGAICLWSGVGRVMERAGFTDRIAAFLMPLLGRLFPEARRDRVFARALSANVCANLLGLGNAATPMGLQAARRLRNAEDPSAASDGLCRLMVLNTASIQLLPTNVAAIRAALGCAAPFDILPALWITSLCAAGVGLGAAVLLGRLWK